MPIHRGELPGQRFILILSYPDSWNGDKKILEFFAELICVFGLFLWGVEQVWLMQGRRPGSLALPTFQLTLTFKNTSRSKRELLDSGNETLTERASFGDISPLLVKGIYVRSH